MADTLQLTKTRLIGGFWEGILTGAGDAIPQLVITHLGEAVAGVTCSPDQAAGVWHVKVPVPQDRIADGVQTFLISDAATGTHLASFALLTGDPLTDDLRAEVSLLREELDMLKKAFRRHCLETP